MSQKKKNRGKYMTKHTNSNVAELLRRVEFSVASKGSNFLLKVNASTNNFLTFTPSALDENTINTQKEMWRICANNTIKTVEFLEVNLESIYSVVLSIFDPVLKDQVCNSEDCEDIDNKRQIEATEV